ncbi:HAD family hydrolase [Brachybacterium sp. AOP43-C2-M15]|uniref:HAD family hydrolase n=1 Tax=Brachybacterium sp. AOP43-C2-M15 TaxID=3457661 RepID=UPI004033A25C
MLLDLDGTLVDRQQAFEDWARSFIDGIDAGPGELDWLVEADRGGYRPRAELAADIVRRLRPGMQADEIQKHLQLGVVEGITCYPGVPEALRELRGIGADLVLVTNGTVVQQTAKLERTGLGPLLDRVVISEEAGMKKPDPRIFALAADGTAQGAETWMIGDHPTADIEGGRAAGLSTGWVSHERPWPHPWDPTLTATTTAELLGLLLARHR